jgi:hypothetical protein
MAAAVLKPLDSDPLIRLKLVCEASDHKYNVSQNVSSDVRVSASEGALELNLDINELQEFCSMSTRTTVRSFIAQLITCLATVCKVFSECHNNKVKEDRKWSDVVAGRPSHIHEINSAAPQPIGTVITSRPPQHLDRVYKMRKPETKKAPKPSTMGKESKQHQNKKPSITILGDSHARGIAGELLHQLDCRYKITGHLKPNASLTEVIEISKKDLSKLTKKDTIIIVGGSNDFDKNAYRNNLTSLIKFLDDTQNTNIILTEVPMRYDIGVGSPINEKITSYNKKLQKVAKCFSHVKLTRVTNNREHFTKHGLHLNRTGKEILSKEITKYLSIKQGSQKAIVIELPWGDGLRKLDAQPTQIEKLNEIPNIDKAIAVEDAKKLCNITNNNCIVNKTAKDVNLKATPSSNEQQSDKHNLKPQRNCPKIRNDDFLWK